MKPKKTTLKPQKRYLEGEALKQRFGKRFFVGTIFVFVIGFGFGYIFCESQLDKQSMPYELTQKVHHTEDKYKLFKAPKLGQQNDK